MSQKQKKPDEYYAGDGGWRNGPAVGGPDNDGLYRMAWDTSAPPGSPIDAATKDEEFRRRQYYEEIRDQEMRKREQSSGYLRGRSRPIVPREYDWDELTIQSWLLEAMEEARSYRGYKFEEIARGRVMFRRNAILLLQDMVLPLRFAGPWLRVLDMLILAEREVPAPVHQQAERQISFTD